MELSLFNMAVAGHLTHSGNTILWQPPFAQDQRHTLVHFQGFPLTDLPTKFVTGADLPP